MLVCVEFVSADPSLARRANKTRQNETKPTNVTLTHTFPGSEVAVCWKKRLPPHPSPEIFWLETPRPAGGCILARTSNPLRVGDGILSVNYRQRPLAQVLAGAMKLRTLFNMFITGRGCWYAG